MFLSASADPEPRSPAHDIALGPNRLLLNFSEFHVPSHCGPKHSDAMAAFMNLQSNPLNLNRKDVDVICIEIWPLRSMKDRHWNPLRCRSTIVPPHASSAGGKVVITKSVRIAAAQFVLVVTMSTGRCRKCTGIITIRSLSRPDLGPWPREEYIGDFLVRRFWPEGSINQCCDRARMPTVGVDE